MPKWLDQLASDVRGKVSKAPLPDDVNPMLATLTDNHFSHPDWLFERKLDGERCLAFHDGTSTRLYSRKPKSLDATYPDIRDPLATHERSFVVDGEIVAFEGKTTSFSRLQKRMQIKNEAEARQSGIKVYYYVFDLLYLDGYDITALPLRERKRLLEESLRFEAPLRYTQHRNETGEDYLKEACQKGWEGLIAKDAQAGYRKGRSKKWLKFKCVNQQEMVVVGYTDPEGERTGFGALLLGFYEGKQLHYAGRVGTGFDERELKDLHERLRALEQDEPPVVDAAKAKSKGVHWVEPTLVAEIGFTEWTDDNRLRHPRYLGLRDDKSPKDVIKEEPGART
ncbi:non-homologous end-joining DNA ligase [Marinobacter fonticola]|uniref:non-homologous end-joining DNA ligase n=1 Tax=Marinobacter fonticola TaxID=2603215 RepID=UPI0011E7D054|nr:non-homologous end-joining DNA ligase [Marinobacter fonticola]